MSVIVMGMEMPDKCCDCNAETCDENYYGDESNHRCSYIYKGYTRKIRDSGRLDECPLRPLPAKHGRLGDLDELEDVFWQVNHSQSAGYVQDAETIVEAEGK